MTTPQTMHAVAIDARRIDRIPYAATTTRSGQVRQATRALISEP
ncbi:MAG: hypothetical protein WB696_20865 [Chthoniobacterales bacterium]